MKIKLTIILLCLIQSAFAQEIVGTWHGKLTVQGQNLPLVFHIAQQEGQYKSTFDSPAQGAKGISIKHTRFENKILTLEAPNLAITFEGTLKDDHIAGTFSQNGMNLPLTLSRSNTNDEPQRPQNPKSPYPYDTLEVSFKNDLQGNLLSGTLSAPKNFDQSKPIIVMITGSGAQNRDEELFGHKPFLVIADYLAQKGIASLRLDDRGIGGSEPGKEGATSADFATDITTAVDYLKQKGYKDIGLLGHSEGGMIAPMVADINKAVKFLVLLAAPGVPIPELLQKQSYELAKTSGMPETVLQANGELNKKVYTYIKEYKGSNLKKDLSTVLVTELQKLPEEQMPKDKIAETAQIQAEQMASPWFQYFIKYNPDDYLSKVKIPVLAINGSLDLQVSAKENLSAIKKSLAGNKQVEIIEFEHLNHLLQTAKTGSPSEYGQIEETISPNVLDRIASWVLALPAPNSK